MQNNDKKKDEAAGKSPPATAKRTVAGIGIPRIPAKKPPREGGVDELSGSLLVDEPSVESAAGTLPRPRVPPKSATATLPSEQRPPKSDTTTLPSEQRPPVVSDASRTAPTVPPAGPPPPPLESAHKPASGWLPDILKKPLLPIIGLAGLMAGIGLVMIMVKATRGHEVSAGVPLAPSAGASSSVTPISSQTEAPAPVASVSALTPCTLAGEPRLIAPNAIVAAGIEVRAFGNYIALGFAPNDHQAMVVGLDPETLTTSQSTVSPSIRTIRRVSPIPGRKGKLDFAIDVDRNGDPLQGRRTLPLDPPVQVGVADGHLAWAPLDRSIQGPLWQLEGDGPVEALRGARSESNPAMVAIAFRRAGAVWFGTAERSTTLAAKGDLAHVTGLGPMVGSPAIAINEGTILAAWADRPSPDDPWQLRWVRFKAGEAAGEPHAFKPPPGGRGDEAMSPGLAVVPGGRFLLVWTEGAATAHSVRALTLSSDGMATGTAIALSADGVNAGQGQAALTPNGHGIVAFLESDPNGFHVSAAPIACSP